jgi:ubiquinone/menaquinone biosynthesis C-methylase UbiE
MDSASAEDSKRLVQDSYDKIAETYLKWSLEKPSARVNYLEKLFSHLQDASNARILELGCGAGIPCTKILTERCAEVVANDISEAQIELAKSNVLTANVQFTRADMTSLSFEPSSFQAVVAYFSIIHLPRDEQASTMAKIWAWLSPGGFFVCNLGVSDNTITNEDWLGSRMFWSSFSAGTYVQILRDIGFEVIESETLHDNEDGRLVPFLWIIVQKKPKTDI